MKKSEIYRQAQSAVMQTGDLTIACKLEILRELMNMEDLAIFTEEQEGEEQ